MRRSAWLCLTITVAACGRGETHATADSTATPAAVPRAPADFAGRWTVSAVREGSDISYVTYDVIATADTGGWTAVFPGRPAIPARVLALGADSVVVEIGPYQSVIRPGVTVVARTVSHLVDGRLAGRFDAHYRTRGADSLVTGRLEGTRAP